MLSSKYRANAFSGYETERGRQNKAISLIFPREKVLKAGGNPNKEGK
jgi:hypothetical protein